MNSPARQLTSQHTLRNNVRRAFTSAVLICTAAACRSPKADTAADSASVAPLPAPAPASAQPGTGVTEYGYGPVRAGVPFAVANDSLKGALKAAPGANLAECDYVKWEGGPAGLLIMVVAGKIARVDVTDSTIATQAGARVGDTEERVQSLYPGRVSVTPHKYADGHYLKVKSSNLADSLNFIIFETEKNRVTRYRGGVMPAVEYVEGCS